MSTSTRILRAKLPKTWRPTPPALRTTLLATCGACGQLARMPFGGLVDDDLCDPCRDGDVLADEGGAR